MSSDALTVDVYVAPMRPFAGAPAQGPGDGPMWSPMSSTLIAGAEEAVLVDTLVTFDQVDALAEWVRGFEQALDDVHPASHHVPLDPGQVTAGADEPLDHGAAVAEPALKEEMVEEPDQLVLLTRHYRAEPILERSAQRVREPFTLREAQQFAFQVSAAFHPTGLPGPPIKPSRSRRRVPDQRKGAAGGAFMDCFICPR